MSRRNSEFEQSEVATLALPPPLVKFPETNQEADAVEELLSKAMDNLTIDEHERLILDMHGVTDVDDEDAITINNKLQELEVELGNIKEKEAYLLAKKLNESYVANRNFQLMFLRHSDFNVKATAELFVRHFEVKRQLFGDGDVLGRDIRQSDFGPNDKEILDSGIYQILPTRDAAGRALLYFSPFPPWQCHHDWLKLDERSNRTLWYLLMKALQDEKTQKRGIVWVLLNYSGHKVSAQHLHKSIEALSAIPHRNMGGHFCYVDPALRPYATGFHLLAGTRTKRHFGTREQIDFELQTFGIPTQDFPDKMDGSFSTKGHLEWLAAIRAQEEALTSATKVHNEPVIVPRRFDVLFGRSLLAREHTGTRRALHVVEMYFETYETLSRLRKTEVAERIISIIHESGGRFLRRNASGSWEEADEIEARKKVAHWFRHMRQQKPRNSRMEFASDSQTEMNTCSIGEKGAEVSEVQHRMLFDNSMKEISST